MWGPVTSPGQQTPEEDPRNHAGAPKPARDEETRFSDEGRPTSHNPDRRPATKLQEAARTAADRVRPGAERAARSVTDLLQRVWQWLLPLLRALGQRISPLVDRVQRTASPYVRRVRERAEPYVEPVRRKLAPAVEAVRAKLPEPSGRHRRITSRRRSVQIGAAVAGFSVLAVLVGTAMPSSEEHRTEPVAQANTLNAPADAPAPLQAPTAEKGGGPKVLADGGEPTSDQSESEGDQSESEGGEGSGDGESSDEPELNLGPNPSGIDVSNHNGTIEWKKVAKAGKDFTFVLATDGSDFTNPMFHKQFQGAKKAGLVAGAYHFGRPGGSAEAQANRFLDTIGTTDDGRTLPPVLDMEVSPSSGGCYGKSPAQMTSWIQTFLDTVKKRTGDEAIIYASPSFWSQCMGDSKAFADNPLWIAEYQVDKPTVPGGWKNYTFWQFTAKGSVPGIEGPTDLNKFKGSGEKLADLVQD